LAHVSLVCFKKKALNKNVGINIGNYPVKLVEIRTLLSGNCDKR